MTMSKSKRILNIQTENANMQKHGNRKKLLLSLKNRGMNS